MGEYTEVALALVGAVRIRLLPAAPRLSQRRRRLQRSAQEGASRPRHRHRRLQRRRAACVTTPQAPSDQSRACHTASAANPPSSPTAHVHPTSNAGVLSSSHVVRSPQHIMASSLSLSIARSTRLSARVSPPPTTSARRLRSVRRAAAEGILEPSLNMHAQVRCWALRAYSGANSLATQRNAQLTGLPASAVPACSSQRPNTYAPASIDLRVYGPHVVGTVHPGAHRPAGGSVSRGRRAVPVRPPRLRRRQTAPARARRRPVAAIRRRSLHPPTPTTASRSTRRRCRWAHELVPRPCDRHRSFDPYRSIGCRRARRRRGERPRVRAGHV